MTPAPPLPARARMWWHAREPRERWLLALFAVLLAGVLIVTLVARPLLDARAAAWRDIDATARNAPPRPAGPTATTPARPAGDPVALARDSAARFGLTVVVSAAGQGVRVTIADAPAESVLR
ncbi:MAG TPA: type II secretion system protein GspM, partial [Sphingomonadaceae bacterium]|nr:type II secretion system protein GspM [Sphingomonadaceae bacterium]